MVGKTIFVHLVIIHVKSWKTKRLKSHHSKNKNSRLQISAMKQFNYLNQGIHVNNLKMKNLLDHQSTIRSITLLPMKIVQSYIWTMIYEWKCKCKCFHLIFNKRCWPLSLVARTIVLQWKQQLFYVIGIMWHIFKLLQLWFILTIPYGTYY
jgi:hypothetical protein